MRSLVAFLIAKPEGFALSTYKMVTVRPSDTILTASTLWAAAVTTGSSDKLEPSKDAGVSNAAALG